jgi:pimeloyl-ACP methyl ester carboxylesterase
LRSQSNIPIWIVGISLGSFSATAAAINISEGIDGLVLLSSNTENKEEWKIYATHPKGILNMELEKITIPTLIIANEEDKCWQSLPSEAPKIKNALVNCPKAELKFINGGKNQSNNPCRGGKHAFYGIEEPVITAIVDFIKSNSQ